MSEVIGFLLTFAIISGILLVAMLGFNDAQRRAEERLIEIQGASAAQRIAAAAVDLALFASENPAAQIEVALDLPAELQGIGYQVRLCQTSDVCGDDAGYCATNACPYVKVVSPPAEDQYQSTFLLGTFCTEANTSASGGSVLLKYYPDDDADTAPDEACIGIVDEVL